MTKSFGMAESNGRGLAWPIKWPCLMFSVLYTNSTTKSDRRSEHHETALLVGVVVVVTVGVVAVDVDVGVVSVVVVVVCCCCC